MVINYSHIVDLTGTETNMIFTEVKALWRSLTHLKEHVTEIINSKNRNAAGDKERAKIIQES